MEKVEFFSRLSVSDLGGYFSCQHKDFGLFWDKRGYRKTFIAQVEEYLGLEVEISQKITPHGWQVIVRVG